MINGTKRIDIVEDAWMDDWFVATSPRSGGSAEGYWCQWVHVARQILAAEQTKERMPEHYRPYDDPGVYSGHHPECPCANTPDPDMEVDP